MTFGVHVSGPDSLCSVSSLVRPPLYAANPAQRQDRTDTTTTSDRMRHWPRRRTGSRIRPIDDDVARTCVCLCASLTARTNLKGSRLFATRTTRASVRSFVNTHVARNAIRMCDAIQLRGGAMVVRCFGNGYPHLCIRSGA